MKPYQIPCPRKAIVVGASSGIGRALAIELAKQGFEVALAARRLDCLIRIQQEIPTRTFVKQLDLRDVDAAVRALEELVNEMGGLDLMVVNSGVNYPNFDLDWNLEYETLKVNVLGFTAVADFACRQFIRQGHGHLVGISSVAMLRGNGRSPAYAASKSFVSNYLDGLRQRVCRIPVHITDIRPGFVNTAMLAGRKNLIFMASSEKAAAQIYNAIKHRKGVAYITRIWGFAAFLLKIIPNWLYDWGYWKVIMDDRKR